MRIALGALVALAFSFVAPPVLGAWTKVSTLGCHKDRAALLSETYIGKDHNVKVEEFSCPGGASELQTRQTAPNVCGAPCTTHCFTPSGGGPNPNECSVISAALRYESQHTGVFFTAGTGTNNTIVMTYNSCKTLFVNQATTDLTYCRTDWAALVDYLAFNCQATQNAHGGLCVANNQLWFAQVQNSAG